MDIIWYDNYDRIIELLCVVFIFWFLQASQLSSEFGDEKSSQTCRNYNTLEGCTFGNNCRYTHKTFTRACRFFYQYVLQLHNIHKFVASSHFITECSVSRKEDQRCNIVHDYYAVGNILWSVCDLNHTIFLLTARSLIASVKQNTASYKTKLWVGTCWIFSSLLSSHHSTICLWDELFTLSWYTHMECFCVDSSEGGCQFGPECYYSHMTELCDGTCGMLHDIAVASKYKAPGPGGDGRKMTDGLVGTLHILWNVKGRWRREFKILRS